MKLPRLASFFFFTLLSSLVAVPAHALVLGDVDGSGVVDLTDVIVATVGFTGPDQFAFLPGDADFDGDVDDEDFLIIISEQALQLPGPGFAYDLIYDASDGSLTIDTKGGLINGYALRSGAFNGDEHETFLLSTFASQSDVLSESSPFVGRAGVFELGAVLAPGLDAAGFADSVSTANYTTGLGEPLASFNLVTVPEPSSMVVLVVSAGLLLGRRRSAKAC